MTPCSECTWLVLDARDVARHHHMHFYFYFAPLLFHLQLVSLCYAIRCVYCRLDFINGCWIVLKVALVDQWKNKISILLTPSCMSSQWFSNVQSYQVILTASCSLRGKHLHSIIRRQNSFELGLWFATKTEFWMIDWLTCMLAQSCIHA